MLRAAFLLFAALTFAEPVSAQPRRDLVMTRVALGDLDLASEVGVARMLRRVEVAARELCEQPRSELFRSASGREWKCRREAVAAAVDRIRAPKLTLAYAEWLSAEPTVEPPSPRR
jgi:UrcA family protein